MQPANGKRVFVYYFFQDSLIFYRKVRKEKKRKVRKGYLNVLCEKLCGLCGSIISSQI
jgi:hypothetical protein